MLPKNVRPQTVVSRYKVTHVLVNDPTRGYGIFIENMLAEAEKVK